MTFFWLAASLALAAPGAPPEPDPRYCDPGEPRHCATALQRGQQAPFGGQLLTDDLAVSLGLKADGCDARVAIEVDFAKRAAGVDLGLERQLRSIDQESCKAATSLLQERLKQAYEPPPLYERPWFVASVTFVLTVGAGSLAIWGAGQLR